MTAAVLTAFAIAAAWLLLSIATTLGLSWVVGRLRRPGLEQHIAEWNRCRFRGCTMRGDLYLWTRWTPEDPQEWVTSHLCPEHAAGMDAEPVQKRRADV